MASFNNALRPSAVIMKRKGDNEKVKALGAKGVVKGSRLGVVWMMLCGGIERARVVLRVVVMIVLLMLRGFSVEELELETIVFLLGMDDMRDLICRTRIIWSWSWKMRPFTLGLKTEDSFVEERNHHMIHKLEILGQGIWVVSPNMLVESSKKHSIRESHVATLGHTYHSVSDVIGKIEGFPNGETIEHLAQACIWMIFVSGEAYGIFTKNDVPFLEYFFQFDVNHLEWIEDGFITFHCTIYGFGSCMKQGITNQGRLFVRRRNFENPSKVLESENGFDIVYDKSNGNSSVESVTANMIHQICLSLADLHLPLKSLLDMRSDLEFKYGFLFHLAPKLLLEIIVGSLNDDGVETQAAGYLV
ncbi:hypothetical protein Tco_0863982 [Tanacetum coccineum]